MFKPNMKITGTGSLASCAFCGSLKPLFLILPKMKVSPFVFLPPNNQAQPNSPTSRPDGGWIAVWTAHRALNSSVPISMAL
jgi:hypothetical protein